jgi:hypothetical protein
MRKNQGKKMKDDGDDDEENAGGNFDETPTKKKAPLNKVQSGRVKKPTPRSRVELSSYAELSENDEENGSDRFIDYNANGHSNSHSNGNCYDDGMNGFGEDGFEEIYYEVEEEA